MKSTAHWRLSPQDITPAILEAVASHIAAGEVVILPTDTVYGLHVSATNASAVQSLYSLKSRESGKPLLVLIAKIDDLDTLGVALTPDTRNVLAQLWPAPLTVVLPLLRPVAAARASSTIAVRVPAVQWLRDLIEISGPLASSSVNVSGKSEVYSMENLDEKVKNGVGAIVDFGSIHEEPSTIVDFTGDDPQVIREGGFRFTQDLWKTSRKML